MITQGQALAMIIDIGENHGQSCYEAAEFMTEIAAYALGGEPWLGDNWTFETWVGQIELRFGIKWPLASRVNTTDGNEK